MEWYLWNINAERDWPHCIRIAHASCPKLNASSESYCKSILKSRFRLENNHIIVAIPRFGGVLCFGTDIAIWWTTAWKAICYYQSQDRGTGVSPWRWRWRGLDLSWLMRSQPEARGIRWLTWRVSNGWRMRRQPSSSTASSRISACEKSVMELVNEAGRIIANQEFRPRHKHVWANLRNANMV